MGKAAVTDFDNGSGLCNLPGEQGWHVVADTQPSAGDPLW